MKIKDKLVDFIDNLMDGDASFLYRKKRLEAANLLKENEDLWTGDELKNSAMLRFMAKDYSLVANDDAEDTEFSCAIENLSPSVYYLKNASSIKKLFDTEDNVEVDNIMNVADKVSEYFGSLVDIEENGFYAMNTAAFTGGFYINVPDNMVVEIPLQLVSAHKSNSDTLFNIRNLIVVGKNSHVKLIQCDDTYSDHDYFVNNVTEIFVKENAHLDLYKMHNMSNNSGAVNSIFIDQDSSSVVNTFNIELNAGYLLGNLNVRMCGDYAENRACGVYLADKQQEMDNYVCIEHIGEHSTSNQVFKGLVDDTARSMFVGKIIVHRDAQRTEASQINKNILLSPKARAYTKPYLEIYADDVKCSHGATVGQLDEEALFYMQQRGLSHDTARKLLLNAFVSEVIEQIDIEPIKLRISDLVKKRLTGELTHCDNCILRCSDSKKQINRLTY